MNWPMVQLQELARPEKGSIVSGPFGSNIGSRFFVEEGIPVIRGNNLTVGRERFVDDGFVFLTEEKASEFKNCEAKKDDIIFTAAGTIGQVGLIPENTKFEKYIISNKQLRVRIDTSKANPVFVYYWLTTREMNRHIIGLNNGGAVPLINLSIIRKLPVPLPPYEKQNKISSILSAYDSLIENNRRRIQLLEQSAQLLYREWFVHLRFPGHEHVRIIDGVPEGWYRDKVENIIGNVHRKKKIKKEDYLNSGKIPCVDQSREFIGGYTNDEEAAFNEQLPIIIFGDHTRVLKFIDFPFASGADGTQLIIPKNDSLTVFFLFFSLDAIDLSNYFYARHFKFLKDKEVLIPTKNLVKQFTEFVQPNMNQINKLKNFNIKLSRTRDILLPRLMNGVIPV